MTRKLALEDLSVGDTFESAEQVMEADAIIAFASEFDPQPFHTDPVAAKDSFFGTLVASGWHTGAVSMRLLTESLPFEHGVIGSGGPLTWASPVYPGDALRVLTRIEEIVPSRSKPGRARVVVHCQTVDQAGEVKQDFRPNLMVWSRDADPQG